MASAVEGGTGTIGISEFASEALGDVVFVELPDVGERVTSGKPFGSVESVKSVNELFTPVTGEVIEVNEALTTHLSWSTTHHMRKVG